MDLGLTGKVALVTAASKGLGKAVATQLAMEGANLVLCSRDPEKVGVVAGSLAREYGIKAVSVAADVSRKEDIDLLYQSVHDQFGRLDILICNAGGPPSGSFLSISDEDWEKSFQTNLMSVVRLVKGAVPMMDKNQWGRVVTIASSSVKQPIPSLILSNTMRAGVAGMMKTLSIELAPLGILLNTVCPGRIATDRLQELDSAKAERESKTVEEVQSGIIGKIPLGRYGRPEEFARVVSFLVSEANSYVTGTIQLVDGGATEAL
jgi:3-oxoacyl-[acyl-carrier protein] reductase